MKALLILDILKATGNNYGLDIVVIDEAIAELEELIKPKTCEGCKHNYLIDNFDSVDGKRLDGFSPNECYICSRNFNDKYELKA